MHRMPVLRPLALAAVLVAMASLPAAGSGRPVAASPGERGRVTVVAGGCPTFSWAADSHAAGYELVVVETDGDGTAVRVALSRRLDGGALGSFTPALDECLAPGRDYAWSVGALELGATAVAEERWSTPRRFRVALAPSEEEIAAALHVLARARGLRGDALPQAPRGVAPAPPARHAAAPPASAPAAAPAVAAVRGEAAAAAAAGVVGVSSASSGTGPGVYGETASWQAAGVLGRAADEGGDGIRGESPGTGGFGVHGLATGAAGTGVMGETTGTLGSGVEGRFSSSTGSGRGVYGTSAATNGYGAVSGWATASSGSNPGVRGDTSSSNGSGVLGLAYNNALTGGTGVQGEAQTTTGKGVYGRASSTTGQTYGIWGDVSSTAGKAVYGISRATSGTSYAVYGEVSATTAYAGYFGGKVHVTGTLSKGGGSFKIDHPLDPEHRYLYHSFVESPDMMNVYNGNVTLDERGSAWVELPDWFEALNRDFRYQLTPIGQPSAVWIGREIAANRFEIRGGPGVRVSWQVTGIRHDKFAEAHRIPVEEVKPDDEQGTYLHPREWGLNVERGLDARATVAPPPPVPAPPPQEVSDDPR